MKVTLIRPPNVLPYKAALEDALPPIGLAYLAAALKSAGHAVAAVDAVGDALTQWDRVEGWPNVYAHGLSIPEVVERIPADTELIGVTCMFSATWPYVRMVLDAIRERCPGVPIVIGGEHVTAVPEYILETCRAVDYCVLGEGEGPMVALADALSESKDPEYVSKSVPGIMCRVGGQITRGLPAKRIREIDSIEVPDWTIFPVQKYLDGGFQYGLDLGRSMPLLASRGCPYQCTFCSSPKMWTTLWRARSPESVVREMKHYIEEYQASNFDFYDLTAIVRKDWIIAFSKLVMSELPPITWQLPSGTRSEAIDSETSKYMYESGCRNLIYAPESASERTLALIKKRVKPGRILKSMRSAYSAGLQVKANMMLGFPGERKRDILPNLAFFLRMAWVGVEDATCFAFSPYPGSELFDQLAKQGEIKLSDAYFRSLFDYVTPSTIRSYSENMSSTFVRVVCVLCMGVFYATSLLLRPARAWRLFRNLFINEHPETRLEMALFRLRRREATTRPLRSAEAKS
jgi:anaerobic magnesium-protoporphyrin IX monomethyl ester cyclase